jgi:hypothetical protein
MAGASFAVKPENRKRQRKAKGGVNVVGRPPVASNGIHPDQATNTVKSLVLKTVSDSIAPSQALLFRCLSLSVLTDAYR